MPVPVDTEDYTNSFNTALTPEQEAAYQLWAKANPRLANTYDYDSRGFWAAGAAAAPNGHGSDHWKKPNHPTFSDQSMYASPDAPGGHWERDGTKWTFTTGPTNELHHDQEELQKYFQEVEPGNVLIYSGAKK